MHGQICNYVPQSKLDSKAKEIEIYYILAALGAFFSVCDVDKIHL